MSTDNMQGEGYRPGEVTERSLVEPAIQSNPAVQADAGPIAAERASARVGAAEAVTPAAVAEVKGAKRISRSQLIMRRFLRSGEAKVGLVGLTLIILLAIFGPYIGQWKFDDVDPENFLTGPSATHWFGTTQGGQDVFAMTLEGLRKSLVIGFSVALLLEFLAAAFGSISAYFGGKVDRAIMWFVDLMLVVPAFLMTAVLAQKSARTGHSMLFLIILLALFGWMISGRVIRAMTMSVVSLDYVTAAKYMSVPWYVTIFRHVIPNISSYLIIDTTLGVSAAIMSETALSYFGLGIQAPDTSLGTLLQQGTPAAQTYPWIFLAPAAVLTLTLIFVNFLGDGLRDAIDPTSKSGGKA